MNTSAVAPRRRLDLDDGGAEIGELERQHVAGDQAREIEHAHAVERAPGARIETDGRSADGARHRVRIDEPRARGKPAIASNTRKNERPDFPTEADPSFERKRTGWASVGRVAGNRIVAERQDRAAARRIEARAVAGDDRIVQPHDRRAALRADAG